MTKIIPGTGALTARGSEVHADVKVESLVQQTEEGAFKDFGFEEKQWIAINKQRWWMLVVIGFLFVLLNTAVIGLIIFALRTDIELLTAHVAATRMVTPAVLCSLIAGMVAQTGAIAYTMAKFLFPG